MSETESVVPNQTNLTHQADDVSGRLSGGENTPQTDQLSAKEEMFSSDTYNKLVLPENLKGQEENFASFKKLLV